MTDDEKILEFCGFKDIGWGDGKAGWWQSPDLICHDWAEKKTHPVIDPNFLFKYADPVLDNIGEHYVILQKKWNDYSVKQVSIGFVGIAKFPDGFEGEGNNYAEAFKQDLIKVIDKEVMPKDK